MNNMTIANMTTADLLALLPVLIGTRDVADPDGTIQATIDLVVAEIGSR